MEVRYVAEFRTKGAEVKDEQGSKKLDSNEVVDKGRKFDSKQAGKAMASGVAVVAMTSRLYAMQKATSNSITGNSVAQRRLDNRMAYLNEGLQVFGSLGIAALINPATMGAAVAALTVSYGLRAYQTSQDNAVKQANWFVESKVNQERQNRLVKDITGIRI